MMMCDMIYDDFHVTCISMYMSLNGTEHMYIVTGRLHIMIYVVFLARSINMRISLNGTEHMYIIMVRLHVMIYKASCLDVFVCLYFLKVWKTCIRV
jgi:hypothetical protein